MTESRNALITGASSGIGLAISKRLLAEGYHVTGLSRRGRVDELDHPNFIGHSLDLARSRETEKLISELVVAQSFDCFIHAAGQGCFGSIEQFSSAQIENAIQVNLTSAIMICRGLIPALRRRGQGRIILIGSESALVTGKKGALYSATKYGLRGFCQSLRDDCCADGIQVSLVNPGMVRSPFFDDLSFAPGDLPENAIEVTDVAEVISHIINSSPDIVFDEINLSPRVKSINFGKKR